MDKSLIITILGTIVGALLGGWIGAFIQSSSQRKLHKADLLWSFRLKIYEAEQEMWQAEHYQQFIAPINWLQVATSDPRIKIDSSYVEEYEKALRKGFEYRKAQEEYTEEAGILSKLLKTVKEARLRLDSLVMIRLEKLKI